MKKTAAKKSPAKKTAAKKTTAKQAPAKKATKKTAAKKAAKQAPAKKAAKKTPAKKAAAKQAPAKKAAAKQTPAKKAPAKKAAKKTPAAAAPASEPTLATNLGARIAPGDHLVLELGDNDAIDRYTFTITRYDDDGLAVAWQMEGVGDHGDIVYTRHALDDARKLTLMSQGGTLYADASDSDERVDGSMPPFLVSRAFLRDLHDGEATCTMPAINQEHSFTPGDRGTQKIVFGGAEVLVPTITAVGDDIELVVVDDPSFPLVLRRTEFDDDNVLFHEHR